MQKIKIGELNNFFARISDKRELYLPVNDNNGKAFYTRWHDGATLSNKINTVRSAKDFFFPQHESIVDFQVQGQSITVNDIERNTGEFVIFGVRACDNESFEILDKVFLSEPIDTLYSERRNRATIITLACNFPVETCFCSEFGIDASNPGGDISSFIDEQFLYLSANTEKGMSLLDELSEITMQCDESQIEDIQQTIRDRIENLPLKNLPLNKFGSGTTDKYFDSNEWNKLSEKCLGCGSCTYSCPTCQCYDIKDKKNGESIIRFRCWDSCMYSDFTKMSAGQPRFTRKERFRQRFMHKLVYFPENNQNLFGCVGCGRCLNVCPISMNIVKVIKALGGDIGDKK